MSLSPNTQSKDILRQTLLTKRRQFDGAARAQADGIITNKIIAFITAEKVKTLGVYWPIRGETDLRPLYAQLHTQNVRLILPVVTKKDAALEFVHWSPDDEMVKDAFGVPIPKHMDMAPTPEVLLVPCLGFNKKHFRLGYGAGFYDRTLANPPRPTTLGVAYAHQEITLTPDAHDIPLDMIIHE